MVEFKDPSLKPKPEIPTPKVEKKTKSPTKTTTKKSVKKKKTKTAKKGRKPSRITMLKEAGVKPPITDIPKETKEKDLPDTKESVRGRPRTHEIDEKDIKRIATMAGLGLKVDDISAILGMSISTFERRCREKPEIYEALLKGRGEARLGLAKKAYEQAMQGDTTLLIFLLKTQCGFKDNDENRINININTDDKKEMSREDKLKFLEDRISYDDLTILIEKEREQRNMPSKKQEVIDISRSE
jgi:hypothetical protein